MPRRAHHSQVTRGVLTDVPEEACLPQAEIDRAAVVSKVRATVVCNVPFMVERSILCVRSSYYYYYYYHTVPYMY